MPPGSEPLRLAIVACAAGEISSTDAPSSLRNDLVQPIHAKAMPVILTSQDEYDQWLTAPVPEALRLQRPLPNELLQIVASGEREDALAA
jgi:putative SOS response-associated peptidase YedK